MILTKKGLLKILLVAFLYLIIGGGCIATGIVFVGKGINSKPLFSLGGIALFIGALGTLFGRYAEGKGILLNLSLTLVRKELKPAEFIKEYERLTSSDDLIVNKPGVDVLNQLAVAYYALGDNASCLATVDKMISVARGKARGFAMLVKSSFLFSLGEHDEAERLFCEAQSMKLDFLGKFLADQILKGDRAIAIGDYRLAEAHNLKKLNDTSPALDNLGKLTVHHTLGEIYEKMGEGGKAITHYSYCVENGGETVMRATAKDAVERLSQNC